MGAPRGNKNAAGSRGGTKHRAGGFNAKSSNPLRADKNFMKHVAGEKMRNLVKSHTNARADRAIKTFKGLKLKRK